MVTLASNTIRCIVRELGGSPSVTTYDAKIDLDAEGDGSNNDDTEFAQFNTDHADDGGWIRLYVPAGTFKLVDQTRWPEGFERLSILGEEPVGGVWTSKFNKPPAVLANCIPADQLHSVRIEAASLGSTTLTVKNEDPSGTGRTLAQLMALFTPGQRVCVGEYDLQGSSYPPNAAFFEYKEIVSVGASTLTIDTPLERAYSDLTPGYNIGAPQSDQGGPATVFVLEDWYDAEIDLKNLELAFNEGEGDGFPISAKSITFTNCNFVAECWPSASEYVLIQDCALTTVEVDKLHKYVEFNNCTTTEQIVFFSSVPLECVVRNSTIHSFNGTNRNILVEDTTVQNGCKIGPTSYGWGERAVFTDCVMGSTLPSFSIRQYSLAGCAFQSGGIVRGFFMNVGSRTGVPEVGQTLTGATSGATATVTWVDPVYSLPMLGTVTGGPFEIDEAVSTPTMTAGFYRSNIFGQEWAGEGAKMMFSTVNVRDAFSANILSLYTDGQYNYIDTDVTSWPSYGDGAFLQAYAHPCPDFTMTGCTGNDWVVAWSQAPANHMLCTWTKYWLKNDGTLSSPPTIYGRIVSITIDVTTAYTGSQTNLYISQSLFGVTGLRGPGYSYVTAPEDRLQILVDLKTTGTRVFSPDGNTGIQGSDVTDDLDFNIAGISPILVTSTSEYATAYTGLPGESSSVWPAFTVTIVTEV
jgi:hypothetical protein